MKNLKRLGLMTIGMVVTTTALNAQDKVETTVSADVVNQYIWRGQDLGDVGLQPTLGLVTRD
jgi:hypothetical protein